VLVSVLAAAALFFVGPIPQDPAFHQFADSRQIAGVSNFWNVLSNLPFIAVGMLGRFRYPQLSHAETTQGYLVMCLGVILVGFGSAIHHYHPGNETLLLDRLAMSVVFMALFSIVLGERVTRSSHPALLWILVASGAASACYWLWTESLGRGDLRPYAIVQYLPALLLPLMLVLFRQRYLRNRLLLASFALYLASKAFEHFDDQVFAATGFVSGHVLKHLASAAVLLCILYAVPAGPVRR
jgi:drug/metabolite transporter (DMT)-like permease